MEDEEGRGTTSVLDDDVLGVFVEENPRSTVRELAGKLRLTDSWNE